MQSFLAYDINHCHFRRGKKSYGGSPCAGAPAYIQDTAVKSEQSRLMFVIEVRDDAEREYLALVNMA